MRLQLVPFVGCISFLALLTSAARLPSERLAPELRGRHSFEERDGVKRSIFEHEATDSKIDFVTNSGICETTPGVNQYSGYFSVGVNRHMWFWFFESRHDPQHAPLAIWLNGGPGCASMIGLFEENGPCQFYNGSTTPSLNPYSWNEYANMLYIDQPVGVGFSYETGASNATWVCDDNEQCTPTGVVNGTVEVNSTISAAPPVWKFLQAFYAHFPAYENRDLGLFTESYGGHYGPEFAAYIESQNKAIASGSIVGQHLDLVALGINNGCYERIIEEKQQIEYLYKNSYFPLINESTYESLLHAYYTNCSKGLEVCANGGTDAECMAANVNCILNVDDPMGNAVDPNIDWYDIRQSGDNTTPPSTYVNYLSNPAIMKVIGARTNYTECSGPVHDQFSSTGDQATTFLPQLSTVVQSGIQTVMFAGDADSVCDWFGGLAVANAITFQGSSEFGHKEVGNYTVDGDIGGTFKTVDNLSWLRVFAAGHQVPYFQPALALQVFKQTMQKKPLSST